MPTLSANIKWASNLEELRAELKSGTDQIVVLQKAAERTERSLGGEGLMRSAHNAAAAVQALGGVTKLTAGEQEKINSLMERAIDKYRVLGQTAPTALTQIADATRRVEEPSSRLMSVMGSMFGQMTAANLFTGALEKVAGGIGAALRAVPGMVEHTISLGAEMYITSLKTGIAVESLSKLRYAATIAGTDLGSLTRSIFMMEAQLGSTGEKGKAARDAIGRLHLSFKDLKDSKPEDAFISVLDAMRQLPNEADRINIGKALFGRGFRETAQLAALDIKELMKEAEDLGIVMSTDTAAAAHAAEDAIEMFKFQLEAGANRIGAAFLPAVIGLSHDLSTLFKGAVDDANKSLDDMGKGGGFLSTVARAMGTGSGALAAQTELYYQLRDAAISFVRNGIEPVITASGFVMQEFNATKVLIELVLGGYQALAYGVEDVIWAYLKLAKYTDPLNAKMYDAAAASIEKDMNRLADSMAQGQENIKQYKKNEKDWADGAKKINEEIEAGLKKVEASHVDVAAIIAKVAAVSHAATKTMGSDNDELGETSEKLREKFEKSLGELQVKLAAAAKNHQPLIKQVKLYGQESSKAAEEANTWGIDVGDAVRNVAAEFDKAQLDKKVEQATKALNSEAARRTKEYWDSLTKGATNSFKDWTKGTEDNLKIIETATHDTERIIAQSTERTLDGQLAAIREEANARRAALKEQGDFAQEAWDAIAEYERVASAKVTRDWLDGGAKRIDELKFEAQHAKESYDYMLKSGLYTDAELQAAWEKMIDAQILASDGLKRAYYEFIKELPKQVSDALASILTHTQSFREGFESIWKAIVGDIEAILSRFINSFLTGLFNRFLASFSGQSSNAVAGMFNMGGAGGVQAGGGLPVNYGNILGLFGGGVAGATSGSIALGAGTATGGGATGLLPSTSYVGTASAPTGGGAAAAGGGAGWGSIAGGGLMAAGGLMMMFNNPNNSKAQNVMGGAMTGAGVGTMIMPGIGTAIGAGIGAIAGGIKSLFSTAGRDAVKAFAAQMGGFESLHKTLQTKLGTAGEQYWVQLTQKVGRGDEAAAKKVIDQITAALAEADEKAASFNTELGGLLQQFAEMGGDATVLEPLLANLRETGRLSAENLAALAQLAGNTTPTFEQMQKAADALGISTDKLGQSFQNARAQANWQSVIDNIDTLVRGGADLNALLGDEGLQKKINELVQQSIKFGTVIPENARPWVEQLAHEGKLLDENGNKITDTSKLTFGESLQTSMQKLIDKITELIKNFSTTLPAAVANAPKGYTIDITEQHHYRYDEEGNGGDGTETASTGGLVSAAGKILHFSRGGIVPAENFSAGGVARVLRFTPKGPDTVAAMLRPGEGVFTPEQMARVADGLSSGITAMSAVEQTAAVSGDGTYGQAVVILEVDKRELGRATVPVLPGQARRLGVRVRH